MVYGSILSFSRVQWILIAWIARPQQFSVFTIPERHSQNNGFSFLNCINVSLVNIQLAGLK